MTMKYLKNIALSIVSLVIFFGSAELISRLKYNPQEIKHEWIFEYDKDKVYRLKRNIEGSCADKPVTTNSQGYRDAEIQVEKPANTMRIVAVGDSLTFGHGVFANETYTEILEDMLNNNNNNNNGPVEFDVINTAVPGNSPFQEYYDLERALEFEPDMVVIQFTLNDIVEPYLVYKKFGGSGKDYHGIEDAPYYHYILSQHSAFYLFLRDLAARIKFFDPSGDNIKEKAIDREIYSAENLVYKGDDPRIEEAWAEGLRWLQKIVDTAKQQGAVPILLASPFKFQLILDPKQDLPQRILREFAEKNGIIYIDLLAHLRSDLAARTTTLHRDSAKKTKISPGIADEFWHTYFLDYDHYTPKGHKYVAEILYPIVVDHLHAGPDT